MIKIPPTGGYTQPNSSDKEGSVWYSKNLNFDEKGYMKSSPRMVKIMDDVEDGQFGLPFAIGRYGDGQYQVATASNANFQATLTDSERTFTEDTGSSNPTLNYYGDAVWWRGLWHASSDTAVFSRPATGGATQAWTSRISPLTTSKNHCMVVFQSQSGSTLLIANGNVLKQYDTSYSSTTDLTITTDYEIVGLAYNASRVAVITRLANDGTNGQDQEARLFIWDGANAAANSDTGLSSDAGISVCAYKSSFVVLNRSGELLYYNGGGFDKLASFPFFFTNKYFNNIYDTSNLGKVYMKSKGNKIYISIGIQFDQFGSKEETVDMQNPSGVWCFDPNVGIYHKYSPSISTAYVNNVSDSGVDIATDILTASAGVFGLQTIPATGNPCFMSSGTIGGLTLNKVYFIIYLSSTTFKLAETKEKALAGDYIDIASIGDTHNYFWMYDLKDYGNSSYSAAGALAFTGNGSNVYDDIVVGARLALTADLGTNDSLCTPTPFLENISQYVSPKIFPQGTEDFARKIILKHRPLKDTDSIIIKYRTEEIYGLPVSTSGGTWMGTKDISTTTDLSEAKTALDNGVEIEMEVISGTGAGSLVRVKSINYESGTYSLELYEDVVGASSSLQSTFILCNWTTLVTITNTNDGYYENPFPTSGKYLQVKVILKGYDITVEEINIDNTTKK